MVKFSLKICSYLRILKDNPQIFWYRWIANKVTFLKAIDRFQIWQSFRWDIFVKVENFQKFSKILYFGANNFFHTQNLYGKLYTNRRVSWSSTIYLANAKPNLALFSLGGANFFASLQHAYRRACKLARCKLRLMHAVCMLACMFGACCMHEKNRAQTWKNFFAPSP